MSELSTAYGVNSTKYYNINAGTAGMSSFVTEDWMENLKFVTDTFATGTDTVALDGKVYMGRVPKGARVVGFHFCQDGAGAASVGTVYVGTTAATASSALTDMTSATAQLVPALIGVAATATTAESYVYIQLATADWDASTNAMLTTFYIPNGIGV